MPLIGGIDAFLGDAAIPNVEEAHFDALIERQSAIVSIFRERPDLALVPYDLSIVADRFAIEQRAADNPIYERLFLTGLDIATIQPHDYFPEWEEVRYLNVVENIRRKGVGSYWQLRNQDVLAFALIDLSLYFLHLVNIYTPVAGSLRNAFALGTTKDIIGREDQSGGLAAVEKILRRQLPQVDHLGFRVRDVMRLMSRSTGHAVPVRNNGIQFELECMNRLRDADFEVRPTPTSGDFGADVIAYKDGLGYAIQCKDFAKPVGVSAIQEVVGARSHYRLDYAAVCAASGFTRAARELANSNEVILTDIEQLARMLEAV